MHRIYLILFFYLALFNMAIAGPPFITDDPEPVEYKHWEFYISSIHSIQSKTFSGTLPHFETNYGILPNVQVHLLLPFNYIFELHQNAKYGYANTELGIKFRFIQENNYVPQIGTFPIIEIPTIPNNSFSNNKIQLYVPLWIQKSWNKLTTYGGGGYWFNPGNNNKNWIYEGWEIQYDFNKKITLGGEIFYHSPSSIDENGILAFNFGGFMNFTEKFHFIYSVGHGLNSNSRIFMLYAGLLWTI